MKKKVESQWYLRGSLPKIPLGNKEGFTLNGYWATDKIEATVPGGVHMDLFNHGLIENPYYEKNSLKCEWVEKRWWIYETDICINEKECRKKELVFEGLDYNCEIFVNDDSVGCHENMFTEKRIDISGIKGDKINVKVMFKGFPLEQGQYGSTAEMIVQKSRFGYGWDFATKLVNIGIWKDVYVEYIDEVQLKEARIYTDYSDDKGIIDVSLIFDGKTDDKIRIEVVSPKGDIVTENELDYAEKTTAKIEIDSPELWWPNGMGEHPLYTVRILCAGEKWEYRTGIRSLRYGQNPGASADSIPYTIYINGKRVFAKGANKVPFDHLYGNIDMDTYNWYVKAFIEQNANIVRVWGGGIIEKEEFYDLCDENGIMIWQDFIQSSSREWNTTSKNPEYLKKLCDAARESVKVKRNHVSLTVWTGGNELTDENVKPVKYTDENIALLKEIVDAEDPMRIFLPSTPSGPEYLVDFDSDCNHDVHGPWNYDREIHYTDYNRLKLLFNSEFGVGGPSASTALFLLNNESDVPNINSNYHHGEHWYHSYNRDKKNFGEFKNTDEYVPYGQWVQAEAIRYGLETNRRMAPYSAGVMVWQMNEPWPNSDNTCMMDYFGNPKMVYYWAKNAYSDCEVSLKYDSFEFNGELKTEICANGDTEVCDEDFTATVYTSKGEILGEYTLNCKDLPYTISQKYDDKNKIIFVRLNHRGKTKDYFFSTDLEYPYRPSKMFEKTELEYSLSDLKECDGYLKAIAKVVNKGSAPAYFVNPYDEKMNYVILASDAYFTLLPGEEKEIELTISERMGMFFDKCTDVEPEIKFRWLNK